MGTPAQFAAGAKRRAYNEAKRIAKEKALLAKRKAEDSGLEWRECYRLEHLTYQHWMHVQRQDQYPCDCKDCQQAARDKTDIFILGRHALTMAPCAN